MPCSNVTSRSSDDSITKGITTSAGARCLIGLCFLFALPLAGCATQPQWRTAVLPTDDYQAVYRAAYDVIAEDYQISQASLADGTIRTRPLEFNLEGLARRPGAYISSGAYQRHRRIVTARVKPLDRPGGVRVDLMAELQRESTTQAERMIVTQDIHERPALGMPRRLDYVDEHRAVHWGHVGRDSDTEVELLQRIQHRAREISTRGTPPADSRIIPVEPVVPGTPAEPATPLAEEPAEATAPR